MKFVMGFLSGFAVGAAVALLFAPEAGAELRAGMSATAHEDWDAASTQLHKAMGNVQQ
jgi:gas vesicle protein